MRSFFFDPDSGLLLFFGRIIDFFWLSILTVIGCIPVITLGTSVSACLYCCRKMILHEDSHLTKMFWRSYKDNIKKGILLWMIVLDTFLILGGIVIIIFFDEKIFGHTLNIPFAVSLIVVFALFACLLAFMHVFPLNAFFENTVINTIKNSFLVAVSNLPVTIGILIVNFMPFLLCYWYPALWFFEVMFGVAFCAFCTAQLYRKIMKKLGVEEISVIPDDEGYGMSVDAGEIGIIKNGTDRDDTEEDGIKKNNIKENNIEENEIEENEKEENEN